MLKKFIYISVLMLFINPLKAQQNLTPELLWQIKRVSPVGLAKDKKNLVYSVTSYDLKSENKTKEHFSIPIAGGKPVLVEDYKSLIDDKNLSPDKKFILTSEEVSLIPVKGSELYPELEKSDVYIYNDLHYRHWDKWNEGKFNHVFIKKAGDENDKGIDLLAGEPYHSPQKPFGGDEDYTWSPDGKKVLYVAKKSFGKAYVTSTNTDIYEFDIASGKTKNLTEGRMGYDTNPAFSSTGILAFLSMERDGYEADKNDIILKIEDTFVNLTKFWDETVFSFKWSDDSKYIYFTAATGGTVQLFRVDNIGLTKKMPVVEQITNGEFDINGIVGFSGDIAIVTRTDFNHASEVYTVDLKSGSLKQLTTVNDEFYKGINLSKTESRITKTKDGKDLFSWVIYPPDFDPNKKYPTLLYCQGGPQSALSQFYSFRWNFQLMAAQGYIVIAPNRRGMPGFGVEWNEAISKDWGGKAMDDYLAAIDDLAKEKYVDEARLGAVGASYGGYSVFYLAGIHEKRFKTFISHNGVFNLKSMYGTTEEIFFTNWDAGGAYWETENKAAVKTYKEFDPSNLVTKWDTPILIIVGGKDFRVPMGQGQEAFQAAQLQGIKSRLMYFPEENHWVLNPQNSVIWHTEFFKWLGETLK